MTAMQPVEVRAELTIPIYNLTTPTATKEGGQVQLHLQSNSCNADAPSCGPLPAVAIFAETRLLVSYMSLPKDTNPRARVGEQALLVSRAQMSQQRQPNPAPDSLCAQCRESVLLNTNVINGIENGADLREYLHEHYHPHVGAARLGGRHRRHISAALPATEIMLTAASEAVYEYVVNHRGNMYLAAAAGLLVTACGASAGGEAANVVQLLQQGWGPSGVRGCAAFAMRWHERGAGHSFACSTTD
ncbi:hypothetical protein HaLaN_17732 [Haematococcus lacustris]|uniref:Uncharacterized protein n=1 Tax=Haematococcus lacustris TaxID=44745 RepID=A0A699ZNS6_HAELA|nr:hypothetical protein HaLaN_17732 [Haematococcus lacustris]